jgi:hypothetical protein
MKEHWFWWIMMVTVLIWYTTVTIFVAVRGLVDIKQMLRRLADFKTNEKNDRG